MFNFAFAATGVSSVIVPTLEGCVVVSKVIVRLSEEIVTSALTNDPKVALSVLPPVPVTLVITMLPRIS